MEPEQCPTTAGLVPPGAMSRHMLTRPALIYTVRHTNIHSID